MRKVTKTTIAKAIAFNDVKHYPPARVRVVESKDGKAAADRMRTAIALDRARKIGARIPKR
jgi:hypothetical protein